MRGIFSLDSPVMVFLGKVADLLIVDLLWIVCSLPIVTIGASTAAMHYMCFRIIKNEEGPILKSFFAAFKNNFKKATVLWLICAALLVFLVFDLQAVTSLLNNGSTGAVVLFALFVLCAVVWALIFLYVFGLQAYFENTIRNTLINAMVFGFSHLGWSIIMVVIDAMLVLLGIRYAPVILPVAPICFNCMVLERLFTKHLVKTEDPAPTEE